MSEVWFGHWRACAVIPVYNHGSTARAVVESLVARNLPVILVDDGSNAQTKADLAAIVADFSQASLLTLETNQGKGGAVAAGLIHARSLAFSHALQVDADGQHDLSAIQRFIDQAQQFPGYMVCGRPEYDASVPKSRLVGRKITNFFVAVETLSRAIPDAMCGFRVYPLAETEKLFAKRKLSRRMEFDIEILVRLFWQKVPMLFLPVKVVYPEGGISHFRLIKDNLAFATELAEQLFVGVEEGCDEPAVELFFFSRLLERLWLCLDRLHLLAAAFSSL